jgi:hypothetical protein
VSDCDKFGKTSERQREQWVHLRAVRRTGDMSGAAGDLFGRTGIMSGSAGGKH